MRLVEFNSFDAAASFDENEKPARWFNQMRKKVQIERRTNGKIYLTAGELPNWL